MTLPDSYKLFYITWDSMLDVNKTFGNLTSRLMVKEARLTQGTSFHIENNALAAQQVQKQIFRKRAYA